MNWKTDSSESGNTDKKSPHPEFGRIIKFFMYGSWVGGVYISLYTLFTENYLSDSRVFGVVLICMCSAFVASAVLIRCLYNHSVAIIKTLMFELLIITVFICLPLSGRLLLVLFYILAASFAAFTGALTVYGCVELLHNPPLFKKLLVLIAASVPMNIIPIILQKLFCCSGSLLFALYILITAILIIAFYVSDRKTDIKEEVILPQEILISEKESKHNETIFPNLSEQEYNLALLILKGYTEGDICREMNITINTQKSYRKSVYTKLNIHSKQELFELAEKVRSAPCENR